VEDFSEAIIADAANPLTYAWRGSALCGLGATASALADCEQAIALDHTGTGGSPGCSPITGKATPDVTWGSPRCNGHRSSNWLAWSPWPKGCTSRTGPARTWPARL